MTTVVAINALEIAPILTVSDLDKSIGFYQKLGFSLQERYEQEGKLNGVRLEGGHASVNLTQDDWAKGRDRVKGTGMRLFIPIDQDVDAFAASIKAAGVALESEPEQLPWGRAFMLTDPDGFKITIARLN